MARQMVINTGPLIALSRMEALEIPGRLDLHIIAPDAVHAELAQGVALGYPPSEAAWLNILPLKTAISPMVASVLDAGEAAVIQLALERDIRLVCIDERKGRRMALSVGLRVTGALGLLAKAKRDRVIPAVKPFLDRALASGVHYRPELVQRLLTELGED